MYSAVDRCDNIIAMCPKAKVLRYQDEIFSSLFLIIQVMFHSTALYTSVRHMLTVLCLYIGRGYDHIHVCCPLGYNNNISLCSM